MMINPRTMLLTAAAATALTGSAAAMPLNNIGSPDQSLVQDVRLVCNERGHCYQTRRHVYRGYRYVPRPYAYEGGPYGYESAPSYFYDDYGPGIGLSFGFGGWR